MGGDKKRGEKGSSKGAKVADGEGKRSRWDRGTGLKGSSEGKKGGGSRG